MFRINKKTIALGTLVATPVATELYLRSLDRMIQNRFPNLDPVEAKKTFRTILLKAFTGKLPGVGDLDDSEMDVLFLNEHNRLYKD